MTYTILKINCPRNEKESLFPGFQREEDFIRFDESGRPVGITCRFYDEGGCMVKDNAIDCIYSTLSWKKIKSPLEDIKLS